MSNNLKGMIEVIGETPQSEFPNLAQQDIWKELSIAETLVVPCYKPEIEQLMKVVVIPEIIWTKVIIAPSNNGDPTTNLESDISTGKKLVIEGLLHQKVVYVANLSTQSVHSAEFIVPFSTYIVLKANAQLTDKFKVETFIEDIFIEQLDCKRIFKNVTLFLLAQKSPLN